MPRVGLISDTHGLLRPEAMAFLRGSDFIVHAGDIGNAAVLEALAAIAPVTAVRGNNDKGPWAETVRETELLQVGQVFVNGKSVQAKVVELDVERQPPLERGRLTTRRRSRRA